jgi:hypothetical protein
MSERTVKGEMHGCVVCGRLHELYVVYDGDGKFVDLKVMSADGEKVADPRRPLVACQRHSQGEIEAALARSGRSRQEDD